MKITFIILIALLVTAKTGFSQGFINLGFESAVIKTNGAPQFQIVASNAIPGWSAYVNDTLQNYIPYNVQTLGSAAVILDDSNNISGFAPVQGKYFALLGGSQFSTPQSAAIGQTGLIPITAASILFWGNIGHIQVLFNNQQLNFNQVGTTGNYGIYGADVSNYAGQIGELLFYAPFNTSAIIDNIQFSSTAVPEPSALALLGLAVAALHLYRRRNF